MLVLVDRVCIGVTRTPLVVCGTTPENVINCLGMIGWSGRLHADELKVERVRDPTGDLVLQSEEVAEVAVETIRPQMLVGLGIDQLHVYSDPIARPLHAPFQHITYAQFVTDLLRVDRLVPISERGVA